MIAKGGEREGNSTEESRHQGLVAGEFLTPLGSRIGDRRDYLSPEKKKESCKEGYSERSVSLCNRGTHSPRQSCRQGARGVSPVPLFLSFPLGPCCRGTSSQPTPFCGSCFSLYILLRRNVRSREEACYMRM